jgi:hypothetical protein
MVVMLNSIFIDEPITEIHTKSGVIYLDYSYESHWINSLLKSYHRGYDIDRAIDSLIYFDQNDNPVTDIKKLEIVANHIYESMENMPPAGSHQFLLAPKPPYFITDSDEYYESYSSTPATTPAPASTAMPDAYPAVPANTPNPAPLASTAALSNAQSPAPVAPVTPAQPGTLDVILACNDILKNPPPGTYVKLVQDILRLANSNVPLSRNQLMTIQRTYYHVFQSKVKVIQAAFPAPAPAPATSSSTQTPSNHSIETISVKAALNACDLAIKNLGYSGLTTKNEKKLRNLFNDLSSITNPSIQIPKRLATALKFLEIYLPIQSIARLYVSDAEFQKQLPNWKTLATDPQLKPEINKIPMLDLGITNYPQEIKSLGSSDSVIYIVLYLYKIVYKRLP